MKSWGIKNFLIACFCLVIVLFADIWVHGAAASKIAPLLHLPAPHALQNVFWDAEPYADGITSFNQGKSPYSLQDLQNLLPFAYPPIFAWAGGELARVFPSPWGWRLYVLAYMASVVSLELALALFFLRRLGKTEVVAIFCLAPLCLFMSTVFWSGNIHILWYGAALFAAIPGLKHNRWLWFYLVTFLAVVNQPIFLLLLLLPFFTAQRQYVQGALTAVAAAAVYLAQKLFSPDLYRQFRESIADHLHASRDFGQGAFGISAKLLGRFHISGTEIPGVIQIVFSAAILAALLRLRPRVDRGDRRWWALISVAIVLANPRIMPYDAAFGLIPACFFLIYGTRPPWQWLLLALVVVASVLGHRQLGFSLLLLSGFLVGAWNLSDKRREFYGPTDTDWRQIRRVPSEYVA